MEQNKSSTLERIKEVNPGGISDNMMIARLSRALNESKSQPKDLSLNQETDPNRQQKAREELGQLLSKGNTEEYKQQVKQLYLEQYLTKFGIENVKPQPSQANQKVITQLEQFKERQKAALTHSEKPSVSSFAKNTFNKAIEAFKKPYEQIQDKDQDKKSFIRAVIDTIITKGKSLGNQTSEYENEGYRALLQVEDTKQILSIDRKQPQPNQSNPAFKAEKSGTSDFKVLQDNLSDQEAQNIVVDNQQSQPRQPQQLKLPLQTRIQPKRDLKNKAPELD
ncbi:hypothetical protein A6770_32365 [Nostoc minutum NIES-26]|uniref:Uncharacterized protein n=1 Tax=Nostoc minutum NIES-26 TaxID=1844469 RepID=A0A367Q4L1_9NOSO|nr:hypothetical protein A6770_32365 [Nostoc minutum NIES-26]